MQHRSHAALAALAAVLILGGCIEETDPSTVADTCGASDLRYLEGQSAQVLETMRFGVPVRIIRPGMAVTMDYSETRLNIAVGDDGRIARVYCG